ncbi:SWIM zinc finger family protein [Lachnospiraceae bacterium 29-84]
MKKISEQYITMIAPNANAVNNGRKISQKGGFVKRLCSEDGAFYMGECSGSGKSNYITSADFIEEESPVFRCSCPSRQFPCKHSLALLFEISQGKGFEVCEIPEDILQKRQKKEARTAKAKEGKKAAKPRVNKAARTKKIKKQLEGLGLAEEMMHSLLSAGLGTMGGGSVKTYRDLAKQLGDYYLVGPQISINRLILEIEAFQKDGDSRHYKEAARILVQLRSVVKKARAYLEEKLEKEELEDDGSVLFEELGGIWKLDQLQALGLKKENACLLQLSFQVVYDDARKEFIDIGWWADVETGEVAVTQNFRPVKALKYVKQEDTVFEAASVPILTYYPGEMNRRIRWESASYGPMAKEQLASLRAHAEDSLPVAVKKVKNHIKNTLSENYAMLLFAYQRIGKTEDGFVLQDAEGNTIQMEDMPGMEGTIHQIPMLMDGALLEGQALLGKFFYWEEKRRICLQPYSIITEEQVIRLLY